MVQAGILVSEAVGKAAWKFVTDYQGKVDSRDPKSDELENTKYNFYGKNDDSFLLGRCLLYRYTTFSFSQLSSCSF